MNSALFFTCLLAFTALNDAKVNDNCMGYCGTDCTCEKNDAYQCKDGTCISSKHWNDYRFDCPDKSDEDVECCDGLFKCDTKGGIGRCISNELVDDGKTDCMDGTDETDNNKRICETLIEEAAYYNVTHKHYMYQCQNVTGGSKMGKCIRMTSILDDIEDCPNADDEDPKFLNECELGIHKCDLKTSYCENVPNGGYKCTCLVGFKEQLGSCFPELSNNIFENKDEDESSSMNPMDRDATMMNDIEEATDFPLRQETSMDEIKEEGTEMPLIEDTDMTMIDDINKCMTDCTKNRLTKIECEISCGMV